MKWAVVLLLAGLLAAPQIYAQDIAEEPLPPDEENAAYHYWRAIELMAEPENDELADFLDAWAGSLPPNALHNEPALSFLLNDLTPEGLTGELHKGAICDKCDFGKFELSHLSRFRALARRAWLDARAAEAIGESEQAAQIYADCVHFGVDVARNGPLSSALTGQAIVPLGLDVTAFLYRQPSAEACQTLLNGLNSLPHPAFSFADALRRELAAEEIVFDQQLQALTNKRLDETLDYLREAKTDIEVVEQLVNTLTHLRGMNEKKRKEVYAQWFAAHKRGTERLIAEGAGSLAERTAVIQDVITNLKTEATLALPWASTAIWLGFSETTAYADAQINITRLLAAAALYRAEKGEYPRANDQLKAYFPEGLPQDPFTDAELRYALVDGVPQAICKPPKDMQEGHPMWTFTLSLDEGIKRQEAALTKYLEEKERGE